MTHYRTDDVRIEQGDELLAPMQVMRELPATERSEATTFEARRAVHDILRGADDRLLVVVGPCSIHDYAAAVDYAGRLRQEATRLADDLAIVMRVYFEKPRTTVGWKGYINDPRLDETFDINEGIRLARKLLREVNEIGVPCGTEFLDLISPQYLADLIAWGAIGARTTESQSHRQLASGLSCPVGFKNGTDGNIRIAVDAIKAAASSAHAASSKQYQRQVEVGADVAAQVAGGERRIVGVMVESHINPGRQDLLPGKALEYGVSITDACLGWPDTVKLLEALAGGVRKRRVAVEE